MWEKEFKNWKDCIHIHPDLEPVHYDEDCEIFAKQQKAYMLHPTAIFDDVMYITKTIKFDNANILYTASNLGPLYEVYKEISTDYDSDKTVERNYIDPVTFERKYGLWYQLKSKYVLRYGVKANDKS